MISCAWIQGGLFIERHVINHLEQVAQASYVRREEACGYLLGPDTDPKRIDEVVAMENLANRYHEVDPIAFPRRADEYFLLDARRFQLAFDAGEHNGRPLKVVWHSHLDVGAYFSESDAAAATMEGQQPTHAVAYLVTSVRQHGVDDHRLFIWHQNAFVESEFCIVESTPRL